MVQPLPDKLRQELRRVIVSGRVHFRGDGSLSDAEFRDFGRDRVPLEPEHAAVILPGTVEEVAAVVRIAYREKISIVPSGGRTGYAAGAYGVRGSIVLSLQRMNRVLSFDPYGPTLTVEAGMITRDVQEEASRRGFFFPVDFAAAGSSQIGGNAATNAGGIRVIRYGMMRDWVQGMVVVTGTGEILSFPGGVMKNNAGYDLCRLLVGSEGTLGVITQLTLRLTTPPRESVLLLACVRDFDDVLLALAAAHKGPHPLLAFEYFDAPCLRSVSAHLDLRRPFRGESSHFLLLEWECTDEEDGLAALEIFSGTMGDRLQESRPASARSKALELWKYREGISESLSSRRPHKEDVSLPPADMPKFLRDLADFRAHNADLKDAEVFVFGHVGDGNLHINTVWPGDWSDEKRQRAAQVLDDFVFSGVLAAGGSISAEHGIGLLKKGSLPRMRARTELDAMRAVKKAWDPGGILNPGKLFPDGS